MVSSKFVKQVTGSSLKGTASSYISKRSGEQTSASKFVGQVTSKSLKGAALSKVKKGSISTRASFVKRVGGTSLPQAAMAYYRNKSGGYTLQRKRGATSQKDPVAVALNKMLTAEKGIGKYVSYVYSSKSRVVKGTENLIGVKLESGVKGWVDIKGGFLSLEDARYALRSLDYTTVGYGAEVSLETVWDEATATQKAKIAEVLMDVDWDAFWKEYYPKDDGRGDYDVQAEMYAEIVQRITKAVS